MKPPSIRVRRWRGSAACVAALLLFGTPVVVTADSLPEYEVKAAMLFKIARFVEWPEESFGNDRLRVCVVGDDPFGERIDGLRGKVLNGRTVQVERVLEPHQDEEPCHIAFISSDDDSRSRGWLDGYAGEPVLTVGDRDGFGADGGTVNLLLQGKRIRFEINVAASERAGLKISAQLLQLASIVESRDSGGEG